MICTIQKTEQITKVRLVEWLGFNGTFSTI